MESINIIILNLKRVKSSESNIQNIHHRLTMVARIALRGHIPYQRSSKDTFPGQKIKKSKRSRLTETYLVSIHMKQTFSTQETYKRKTRKTTTAFK